MKQPHILCSKEHIAQQVLLPGDPQRVMRAAEQLDTWKEIAFNREFKTITGKFRDMPVTVTSTGIGGVSAGIAVEELISCGAKHFIRIGSAGALQPNLSVGDLIIPTGAVRQDGASRMYLMEAYPAVADYDLVMELIDACKKLNFTYYKGIIRSHDSFYIDEQREVMKFWGSKNVLGSDMETAALFTISSLRGVKAASILNIVVNHSGDIKEGINEYAESSDKAMEGEKKEIIAALEALYSYYKKHNDQ